MELMDLVVYIGGILTLILVIMEAGYIATAFGWGNFLSIYLHQLFTRLKFTADDLFSTTWLVKHHCASHVACVLHNRNNI